MSNQTVSSSKRVSRWIRQKLLNNVIPKGFASIHDFSPQDIFVVGYPKSGSTWFQALVSGAVYGVLPDIAPMSVVRDLVPDVHAAPWYKRHASSMFFKSHHLPDPRYRRVIYLLRDGRDAVVSYLHYQQALTGQSFNFMEFLHNETLLAPCKWHKHVQAWLANPYQAELMLLRYEDLKADPVKELRRVCEFAGLERSTETLELAARSAAFEKMRAKELIERPASSPWPKGKSFYRRGEVGSYREEMPSEVLEYFMAESAPMLSQCGYS